MTDILAFDLGGTRIKAGLVAADTGAVVATTGAATPPDAEAALTLLDEVGRGLLAGDACHGVGLSVPGLVDDGWVVALPGKLDGIVGRDLRGLLASTFAASAVVANDAVAYGCGEAVFGAGRGDRRVVVVTIGTGVGVAVIEDGRAVGSGPLGGGILGGQIPISEPDGREDTSGRRGTIEARCRAQRIVDEANDAGGDYDSVESVYAGHASRDAATRAGIAAYRRWLARALVALTHAHAPSTIVLGGGPMVADNPVVEGLQDLVDQGLWPGVAVALRLAALGDSAALAGLARLHTEEARA